MENMDNNKELQQQEQNETGNGESTEEKTFTQDQVNKIVEERLSRQKNKYENMMKGMSPEAAELEEKSKDLAKREALFEAKQILLEKGLPLELIDMVKVDDPEKVAESVEAVKGIFDRAIEVGVSEKLKGKAPLKDVPKDTGSDDAVRAAFGL